MSIKSTATHYGKVAVSIHWLSAFVIIVLIGTGFRATGIESTLAKAEVLQLHISFGVAILLLTVVRIGWWLFADKRPKAVPMSSWQDSSSRAIHYFFYVVILGMTASGIGMIILSGTGSIIFGGDPALLPDFEGYVPRTPHGIGARLMLLLFVVHVGAAFYHHIFKKDGLLSRMWFTR